LVGLSKNFKIESGFRRTGTAFLFDKSYQQSIKKKKNTKRNTLFIYPQTFYRRMSKKNRKPRKIHLYSRE